MRYKKIINNWKPYRKPQKATCPVFDSLQSVIGRFDITCSYAPRMMEEQITNTEKILIPGELLIYPNPANSQLNLSLQLPEQKDKQQIIINIFDVLGRQHITKGIEMNDSLLQTTIDINNLPVGVYIVQVVTSEKTFKKMLVISR